MVDTARVKVPFGIAQIGKAFRNEITPRNFIFRSREFEQVWGGRTGGGVNGCREGCSTGGGGGGAVSPGVSGSSGWVRVRRGGEGAARPETGAPRAWRRWRSSTLSGRRRGPRPTRSGSRGRWTGSSPSGSGSAPAAHHLVRAHPASRCYPVPIPVFSPRGSEQTRAALVRRACQGEARALRAGLHRHRLRVPVRQAGQRRAHAQHPTTARLAPSMRALPTSTASLHPHRRPPWTSQELQGCAARGNYDLTQHEAASGKSMECAIGLRHRHGARTGPGLGHGVRGALRPVHAAHKHVAAAAAAGTLTTSSRKSTSRTSSSPRLASTG